MYMCLLKNEVLCYVFYCAGKGHNDNGLTLIIGKEDMVEIEERDCDTRHC